MIKLINMSGAYGVNGQTARVNGYIECKMDITQYLIRNS